MLGWLVDQLFFMISIREVLGRAEVGYFDVAVVRVFLRCQLEEALVLNQVLLAVPRLLVAIRTHRDVGVAAHQEVVAVKLVVMLFLPDLGVLEDQEVSEGVEAALGLTNAPIEAALLMEVRIYPVLIELVSEFSEDPPNIMWLDRCYDSLELLEVYLVRGIEPEPAHDGLVKLGARVVEEAGALHGEGVHAQVLLMQHVLEILVHVDLDALDVDILLVLNINQLERSLEASLLLGHLQPVLHILEVQVKAGLGHQQLDHLCYHFLVFGFVELEWQLYFSLRDVGPQFSVGRRQDHLVEICEAEEAVLVVAVGKDHVKHVLGLEVFVDVLGGVFSDKCVDIIVTDAPLARGVRNQFEKHVAFKLGAFYQPLPQFFDVQLGLTDELENLVHRFKNVSVRRGVAALAL